MPWLLKNVGQDEIHRVSPPRASPQTHLPQLTAISRRGHRKLVSPKSHSELTPLETRLRHKVPQKVQRTQSQRSPRDGALQAVLVIWGDRVHRNLRPRKTQQSASPKIKMIPGENGTRGVEGNAQRWGKVDMLGGSGRGTHKARWFSWFPVYITILKN